ncbi:acyl-CoA carboxylase subunit epsilon [Streptosporangiaceae bacterium NEAU-GS5]|nr:acyl-CoA carboxylase subunit epsilon [Streptosporangiaceae bacterium NEAU-GS5]
MTHLRIIRGDATPEEVAALVAALMITKRPADQPVRKVGSWSDPARRMRRELPSTWRASAFPH